MKIDLIEVWPRHLVYPLHSKWLKENRDRFNKVIIVFSDMNVVGIDYRNHIQNELRDSGITFMDCLPAESDEDWRNKAVNMALSVSDSEWVWFVEQDFTPLEGFWEEIEGLEKGEVWAAFQEDRMHPCCIFIKRDVLEQTSKYFGAVKDKLDHFGQIQKDLQDKVTLWVINPKTYYHMNGLSQNLRMLQLGEEPNYNPPEFKDYCKKCLELDNLPIEFRKLFDEYIM